MKNSNKNSIECNSIEEYCSDVYKLEVDREYLDELHELHNDYPLAPEKPELVIIECQITAAILQINMA